jgi:2'-5' RNA ligase
MEMYFIALVLPLALNEKILRHKNYMQEQYGCRVGLKSPAHITLVPPFWMEEEREPSLREAMDRLAATSTPISLATDHFSHFKPKTIFIALARSEALNALKKNSDTFFSNNPIPGLKMDERPFHPHITIATRDLHKKDFYAAWQFFENKTFMETWMADGVSLLKHNKKNWDVVYTSQFKNAEAMS